MLGKKSVELVVWNTLICNRLCLVSLTCGGSEIVLKEKWCSILFNTRHKHECSILFHMQNKQEWTRWPEFHKWAHPKMKKKDVRRTLWLKLDLDAFKTLHTIILSVCRKTCSVKQTFLIQEVKKFTMRCKINACLKDSISHTWIW